MISDVFTLPDDPIRLKQIPVDFQRHFDKETGILLEQIRLLRAQIYGRKSEKIIPAGGFQPLPLFDMPEPEGLDAEPEEEIRVPAHTRRKRGRKPLPEDLPRVEKVHDIKKEDKVCSCGCELKRIGEEISEQLDIIPAQIRVIRHIRPKYACPECEGVEDEGPTVKIAPVPPQIIPKSIVSPGLLAHILTGRFIDHTPFFRQGKQLIRLGVDVSRTSMCRWAMQAAEACRPLLNLLEEEVQTDETTLHVLAEPGRTPNFQGTVQTDGYQGYDFLDHIEKIGHIGCWAHARRKFTDVTKAQGKNRKAGAADMALRYIKKLYRIERKAKNGGYSPEQVYRMRQEEAKPILDDFEKWLNKKRLQTPPKGLLGKAVAYTLNQWHRLVGYIEDGNASIDNNMAENSIRPFVVGRKSWLFSGIPEGARASALLYSLIETAKANKLEPYSYLRYTFEKLPVAVTLEAYEALLPWNITREQLASSAVVACV